MNCVSKINEDVNKTVSAKNKILTLLTQFYLQPLNLHLLLTFYFYDFANILCIKKLKE